MLPFFLLVSVSLQLHAGNTLKLVYAERKRSEFEQAQLELKNFLKQKIISVSIGLDAILEDFRWYLIKTRIESRGNLLIFPDVRQCFCRKICFWLASKC